MNESDYTAKIHRLLKEEAGIEVWKIADRFKAGIPDAHYAGPGGACLWIEYKWDHQAPRVIHLSDTKKKHALSKLQQDWHTRHHALGHNVAVAYATPQGAMLLRHPNWLTPIGRESFLERALPPRQVVEWIACQLKK